MDVVGASGDRYEKSDRRMGDGWEVNLNREPFAVGFKLTRGSTREWRKPVVHFWLGGWHAWGGWLFRYRKELRRGERQWFPRKAA